MEALATYLIKSSVWLTGFALVYALFLRNERYFVLNRIYLVSGILVSIIFPLFTWHYTVVLPVVSTAEVFEPQVQGIAEVSEPFLTPNVLLLLTYISGIAYLIFRILRQTLPVFRIIRKSEIHQHSSAKLIRTTEYPASFSFFSFVFVNPSVSDTETNEIVNHEMEHIRQQHWIDLLLFEILRTMQWFNPASWFYGHMIRQNHEYLADERALQRSSNPAIYRAALLNQMFGGPVISLANSFNYSLNKKRFNMMKQITYSPIRKLKLLLVLPLMAGVFYAFAAPEYKFIQTEELATNMSQNEKTVKGKVIDESGNPLKSASVVISGKTTGTITDENGNFMLAVTDDSPIVISYVGFETVILPSGAINNDLPVTMKTATIGIEAMGNEITASKPSEISDNVLVIVDGKESDRAEIDKISPDKIASIDVLKDKTSIEKYGEKGKDGVILITLKPDNQNSETYKIQADGPLKIVAADGSGKEPLYIKDGVITPAKDVQNMDPETIESISVFKGETATSKYGEKAKDGAVEFIMKKGVTATTGSKPSETIVIGYRNDPKVNPSNALNSKIEFRNTKTFGATNTPLFVKDGVISPSMKTEDIDPNTIESISVLKDETATSKYGNDGKNGVIEITSKKAAETFFAVEEMPQFPGGVEALKAFVNSTLKYPITALENGIHGQVFVRFVVSKTGKVTDAKITRGVDPSLDKEAVRIVEAMPQWSPGKQNGQAVDVTYAMPVIFTLPANMPSKEKLAIGKKTTSTTEKKAVIKSSQPNNKLIIVPNPTSDNVLITIENYSETKKLEVSIFDNKGKLMKKESKNGPSFSLSFSNFVSGTYLVVANDGTSQFSGQIVVNH
ncbi:MAG: TonB family protein [Prolixibacteraceae bacterium]|nr:TonB family protein [Prolixibacteraceae bacterium]